MKTVDTVPYTVHMQAEDTIRFNDRISWQRKSDRVRMFGHVTAVRSGFILAVSDKGVRFALRHRDVTKECG